VSNGVYFLGEKIMSNDNPLERLWRLQTKVNMLVSDGKRDPKEVADVYQGILDGTFGRAWSEEKGIIYFSVTSDGTTGGGWIARLESQGFLIGGVARHVLRSQYFIPTSGVTTRVAVVKGSLFADNARLMRNICLEADASLFAKSTVEQACLIREKFTDKEIEAMGLSMIVAMHEPVKNDREFLFLLGASRYDGGRRLVACNDRPGFKWDSGDGFAFVESRTGSQH